MQMSKGQKVVLSSLAQSTTLRVALWVKNAPPINFDFSCFGLDISNLCSDDRYFVFYNQRSSPCGGILLLDQKVKDIQVFQVNLLLLPETIKRLVFAVTIDGEGLISKIQEGTLTLFVNNNQVIGRFSFSGNDFNEERALMAGEIYFKDTWKFGIIGQGFNGGLSALLAHFGIEESETGNIGSDLKVNPEDYGLSDNADAHSSSSESDATRGRTFGFFRSIFSSTMSYIDQKKSLKEFKRLLIDYLSDGVLTKEEMNSLKSFCQENDLSLEDALKNSKLEIEKFLRCAIIDIISDGKVTQAEEAVFKSICQFLNPSPQIQEELWSILDRVKFIEQIRKGDVKPLENPNFFTKIDEIVWYHQPHAVLVRELKSGIQKHRGELWISSERIIFKSNEYPVEIQLNNIINIEGTPSKFYVVGKTAKATCGFLVSQGDLLEAYADQALAKFHRKINLKQTARQTRAISQSVKHAVWIRDSGQCVECGATEYLEFDHIIPFSKGGSSSESNVQLLCRKCNLKKSDSL